jgi:aquaglyceroporin related protein, other eukaryote
MVIPFFGCMFGGLLYDLFIYTGPSPVNTPWLGLKRFLKPSEAIKARKERTRRNKAEGNV